jgi:hypothetical protein
MQHIGIVGYGEVGSSLNKVYKNNNINCKISDSYKGYKDDFKDITILNICIPYLELETFISQVKEYITNNVQLILIHSSIGLGVISRLKGLYPMIHIVHSPVRGVHPYLAEGLETFVKFVGHCKGDEKSGKFASEHLNSLGIDTEITDDTTSILAKLFSTTYYGMCIAFTEDMGRICDNYDVDFNKIQVWNNSYNEGYDKLGKGNVKRPVLFRIPDGKSIGGHCVVPNARILKNMFPDFAPSDYILRYE